MNKHSNHVDYICTKARNAMGRRAIGYFGKYSIRQPMNTLIETLLVDWHIQGGFPCNSKPHSVTGYAEKCRQVAIRLIERNGKYKRVLASLKKNDACKAWEAFNRERFSI